METQSATSRIEYSGDITSLIGRMSAAFQIGEATQFSVVEVGYEDCNVVIEAGEKRFFAKLFAKDRTPEEIARYTQIMKTVVNAGINHPELLRIKQDQVVYKDGLVSAVLMPFIQGKTFFDLDRTPNQEEQQAITEQAALINRVTYKPSFLFDGWAIPNIKQSFDRVREFMSEEDKGMVEKAIKTYETIPIGNLPHAFVHGDLTKANVMKGEDGKMYILDFSVANWYPRIQELAVMAANLTHDSQSTLSDRCISIAKDYSKFNSLTSEENNSLYPYALAGVAMELIGAHIEKFINGNEGEETDFWLSLGRDGLREALQ